MAFNRIAVIGAGAWGTALALACARAGRTVSLWARDPVNAAQLANERASRYLPGVRIDDRVTLAADLGRTGMEDLAAEEGGGAGAAGLLEALAVDP